MAYRTELEARLAKKVTRAIVDHQLIEDGDRVMVGLSGGKDSWALFQILDVLRQRAPISFSLVAVNVHSGYEEYRHDLLAAACEARGWEYRIERTDIGVLIEDLLSPTQTPCSLCARLRRGVLYRIADDVGATKIALGHHADDFIETLLLNLFFAGALKAMPAKLVSDDQKHVVIRPLAYAGEAWTLPLPADQGLGLGKPLKLLAEPVQQPIPIYLGSIGPRAVELVGEIADGWLPFMLDPAQPEILLDPLRRGLERAGRAADAVDVAAVVPVAIHDDVAEARNQVRPWLAFYLGAMGAKGKNFYVELAERGGQGASARAVQDLMLAGDRVGAALALTDELIDAGTIATTPDGLDARLAAYAAAGVTTLVAVPSGDKRGVVEALAAARRTSVG